MVKVVDQQSDLFQVLGILEAADFGIMQFPVSSTSTSTRTAELITELNYERSANNLHEILKEIHFWADESLIKHVLAAADNNIYEASTLLEEMVSLEENHKENNDFKTKALKSVMEEPLVNSNELLADTTTGLAEWDCFLQEGLQSNNAEFKHECDNRTAELILESNCETSVNLHEILKEIHFWADESLIKHVLAAADNNIYEASTLLEEMVSLEENHKENNDFKTKALTSVMEEPLVNKNELLADMAMGLAAADNNIYKTSTLSQEMVSLEESHKEKNDFKSKALKSIMEEPLVNKNELLADTTMSLAEWNCFLQEGLRSNNGEFKHECDNRTAELILDLNCETSANNLHEILKKIHFWADESLIKHVLAAADNNIYEASTLLEKMVSLEENHKDNNYFITKALKSFMEEPLVNSNELLADTTTGLAEWDCFLREGLQSNNAEFKHECDKRTAELILDSNCETSVNNLHEILKEIHFWADESLIKHVLAAADNNIDEASNLLEEMVSLEENHEDNNDFKTKALTSVMDEPLVNKNELLANTAMGLAAADNNIYKASALSQEMVSLEENHKEKNDFKSKALKSIMVEPQVNKNELLADTTTGLAEWNRFIQEGLQSNNGKFKHECDTDLKEILNSFKYITIEPEWQEDDAYLVHRKEALQKMRLASCHSKAAKDAYLRGDHLSAKENSQKAREERMAAKRLNEKAAKEILSIRNSKNDQWTLDLHGLHLAEAVAALQEHLWKIEFQVPTNQSVSSNGVKNKSTIVGYAPAVSANCGIEKLGMQLPTLKSRPTSLQVITGRGIHSRGEPVLPAGIRSFLTENGYCFDETRPGVISVQPKFR